MGVMLTCMGRDMTVTKQKQERSGWLPLTVQRYLLHTEKGFSIREIARSEACHPSTIMRQIRKLEGLRDDPLMDEALQRLAANADFSPGTLKHKETCQMTDTLMDESMPDEATLNREAKRILRRLCETGAVLAVAAEMENAVVVRENEDATARTAVVGRGIAQATVLKDWIACNSPGRISRYHITATGRSVLNHMLAEAENLAQGFAESQSVFAGPHIGEAVVPVKGRPMRFSIAASPLTALARRRDKTGAPFLDEDLVAADERLREDFELAQMGPQNTANWARFLAGESPETYVTDTGVKGTPAMARERVVQAIRELGEGLSDVALRCCCFLEGLETAEQQLGWSARSGKIVLRIALMRLSEHYRSQSEGVGRMIG